MTADQFYEVARENLRAHPEWRYGQALFNTLFDLRPDLAEQIRGTERDPFFARGGSGSEELYSFGAFVNQHLSNGERV